MRLLHSSDWHLGAMLGAKKRHRELELTLAWLADTLRREKIDAMLITGDIFDSANPPVRAQELYYRFLVAAGQAGCRELIIIGGNHDGAMFLDAPKLLLKALSIQVVGQPPAAWRDAIIILNDADGRPGAVVAAVPFLREKDVRSGVPGESVDVRAAGVAAGIAAYYAQIGAAAAAQAADLGVPWLLTGHFFATAGKVTAESAARGTPAVGTLNGVNLKTLPENSDYFALGHLHSPQCVGGNSHCRYAGSLLPMSFNPADRAKSVTILDTRTRPLTVETRAIPCFQRLERIRGNRTQLERQLDELAATGAPVWVEAEYTASEFIPKLHRELANRLADTKVELLATRNLHAFDLLTARCGEYETLAALTPETVFLRALTAAKLPEEQQAALLAAFRATVAALNDEADA